MGTTFCGLVPRDTYCIKTDSANEDKRKNIIINYYCEQSISNKINVPQRAGSADFSKGEKGETVWDNDIIRIRNLSLNQNYALFVGGSYNQK